MPLSLVNGDQPRAHSTPCPGCGALLHLTELIPVLFNHIVFSQVVIVHEDPIVCGGCGAIYAMGIGEVNITYCLMPNAAPNKILVPAGRKLYS